MSTASFFAHTMVGWSWVWDSGASLRLGVGGQYVSEQNFLFLDSDFSGLLPTGTVEIGFAF